MHNETEPRAMKNPALAARVIRFGVFEFSPQTGELRKQGLKVKLEPQASKILFLLLEYPGKICTREELQQHLWQDNAFLDFERSLYKGIHTLRGTLGDSATAPRYIETVTGRGYRFIPIPQEPSNHRGRRRNGCKAGSVAVLPFASECADAEMELLNRRIIERVIDTVSRAPGVRVLAYNTVQHHRGKDLDFRRLGENLLVDAIAAGEMIHHNDELLLHVELIDVCDGSQLWGEQFKEHYSDVLQEPEALADKICDRLRPILARTAISRRKQRSRHAA
jgi:DNA-binding winged helix-turn-helix (wHTH) protein